MYDNTILIVEDEALVAQDIRYRMQSVGYTVVGTVGDGEDAMEHVKKYHPDLILMDIMINGDMDGIETAELIRRDYDIPIVFLTAYEDEFTVRRAKEVAPYGYLHKPFETRDLKFMIEMALLRHKLEKELKTVNAELEQRVHERTAELLELNKRLMHEVDEHKQTEIGLRESETRFRETAELLPTVICEVDRLGKVTFINKSGMLLLALEQKDIDKDILFVDFFPVDEASRLKQSFDLIISKDLDGMDDEFRALRHDGTKVVLRIKAVPIYDGISVSGVRSSISDITQLKKTQEELSLAHNELGKKEKELREFSHKLIQTREDEKRRIANDLHDEVGALVVAVTSSLTIAQVEVRDGNSKEAIECITNTKALVRKEVDNLKKLAVSLRPPNLEIIGLCDALRLYFQELTDAANIKIHYCVDIEDDQILSDDISIVLYRVAQESLTNVIKHADARRVEVRLLIEDGNVSFVLKDDGNGFDHKIAQEQKVITRMGIVGMRERVESINGRFDILSRNGKGTEINVLIPLEDQN